MIQYLKLIKGASVIIDKKNIVTKLESITPLLDTISQPEIHSAMTILLNLVESLSHESEKQRQTIQELKNENNRLKGEQGQPSVRPQKASDNADHSSEEDRKKRGKKNKPKKRPKKKDVVKPDRQVELIIDQWH